LLHLLDGLDFVCIFSVFSNCWPNQFHYHFFHFDLKRCVVGLMLLVISPATLILDYFMHLSIDSLFNLKKLLSAELLFHVNQLVIVVSFGNAKVFPFLFQRPRHILRGLFL
jgi:hypothetical protein